MRIGVLMGGVSAERDVSLNTGRGVHRALAERGHDPIAIDWNTREDLCTVLRRERIDTVWIALHGTLGEDGCVQGMLLLEKFIAGRELSVGILGDEVLGTVEIRAKGGFYDYEAKYLRGDNEYLVPAPLDPQVDEAVRAVGLAAYRALGCWGHARVDVRLDELNHPFVLEVNTLPGMTQTSLLPKIAKAAGMDYGTLCERILSGARCG